ncbi:MAG: sigma-54-dependent Fis family transcriptional regulator [Alphaproteobacteria bacterium]|nr:MAG: sigma-54-dependent Fis family transcriptional regulator [Alphaproteobacteria bacterium]
MSQTILIVDDDPTQRRLLDGVLQKNNYKTVMADGGAKALDIVSSGSSTIDLVLLDLVMPEVDGFEVLSRLRPINPELPVIVLTAKGGVETVVEAMKAGAKDFVVKPASPERLIVSIQNALHRHQLSDEVSRLKRRQEGHLTFEDLSSSSPAMQQVTRLGERAAQSQIPILIEGESGVGKELVARAIQGSSDRRGKPFVTVNCGAIPENLVESILFGHEKGSFTGAAEKHQGKFVEADGGTLFLDEIGELPLDMQVKLLRVLQEGEVDAIGSKKPRKIDIRLISATNRNLLEMAQKGEFREDLYYRLNVFPIWIPPLRERMGDLPPLVQYFIQKFASEEDKPVHTIRPDALEMLQSYKWAGNVRELENVIFRAVVLCDGLALRVCDFPQIANFTGTDMRSSLMEEIAPASNLPQGFPNIEMPHGLQDHGMTSAYFDETDSQIQGDIHALDDTGHMRKLEEVEGEMIRFAIEHYSGQMSEVARRLGIGRSTLYRKVRELGLDVRGTGTDD